MSDFYEDKVRAMCALLGVRCDGYPHLPLRVFLCADVGSFTLDTPREMRGHTRGFHSWAEAYRALLTYRVDVESDFPRVLTGSPCPVGMDGTPGSQGTP